MLRSLFFFEIPKILTFKSIHNSCKFTILYFNHESNQFHSDAKYIQGYKKQVNIVKYSQTPNNILFDVLKLRDKNTNNSITDNKINELCSYYKSLTIEQKHEFVKELACKYYTQGKDVCALATTLISEKCNESQIIRLQQKLKMALTPKYKWLFFHIGRQENGVKFLVDMRTDVLVSAPFVLSGPCLEYLVKKANSERVIINLSQIPKSQNVTQLNRVKLQFFANL